MPVYFSYSVGHVFGLLYLLKSTACSLLLSTTHTNTHTEMIQGEQVSLKVDAAGFPLVAWYRLSVHHVHIGIGLKPISLQAAVSNIMQTQKHADLIKIQRNTHIKVPLENISEWGGRRKHDVGYTVINMSPNMIPPCLYCVLLLSLIAMNSWCTLYIYVSTFHIFNAFDGSSVFIHDID